MIVSLLQIVSGLILLYFGAEFLVRGSSSLALRLKISPLIIGLTVVAFGTSMPELTVSVRSALSGQGSVSIGNVVGSNIFNVAAILGISSLIRPLNVNIKLIKNDTPVMILTSVLFIILFYDSKLTFPEGLVLTVGLIVYVFMNLFLAKRAPQTDIQKITEEIPVKKLFKNVYLEILIIIASLIVLIFGARFLVDGSVTLARIIGISEAVIGLTVVAAGTSLPELATSVVASIQKRSDVAIGNVIGSNIFNILGILGISAMVKPIDGKGISYVDAVLMSVLSLLLLPIMRTKYKIQRWEGFTLLVMYGFYLFYLIKS